MANDNGTPSPEDQKKSGFTKVILPDGTPKYYPSSLGPARIRQLALSQAKDVPRGTKENKESWLLKPLVSGETINRVMSAGGESPEEKHKTTEREIAKGGKGAPQFPSLTEKFGIRGTAEGIAALVTPAGRAAFREGATKDTAEFLSQFTSPVQLGLILATGGEGALLKLAPEARILKVMLKIPGKAAMVKFGADALVQLGIPKQPGESDADFVQRRLFSASAVVGTIGGGLASIKDTTHAMLRRHLGLNEDLAGKVSSQVQQINTERARGVAEKATAEAQAARQVAAIDQGTASNVAQERARIDSHVSAVTSALDQYTASLVGEKTQRAIDIKGEAERRLSEAGGTISDLHKQRVRQTAQIVSDANLALDIEKGRVSAPFEDIGRTIKKPITTTSGVRDVVKGSFKEHGVKETEIPSSAFKALGKAQEGDAYVDLEGELQRLQMDESDPVSFNDLTRVREDLWQASQTTKDGQVRTALLDARERVTKMQESAVKEYDKANPSEKGGLSARYRKAKNDYRDFKRGIGMDLAAKFLDTKDAEAETTIPKLKMLLQNTDPEAGIEINEALRTVLASVGVDTKPLTETIRSLRAAREARRTIAPERKEQLAELEKSTKATLSETRKRVGDELTAAQRESRERIKDIEVAGTEQSNVIEEQARTQGKEALSSAEERVKEIKKTGEVVPGRDVEELATLSPDKIAEERVRAMMSKAKANGVGDVLGMALALSGFMRMLSGSMMGLFGMTYGGLRVAMPEMVRNRQFQDWVIRKSGVEPTSKRAVSMRLGIAQLYPMFRKMAQQGQTEGAAAQEAERKAPPARTGPPTREQFLRQQQSR